MYKIGKQSTFLGQTYDVNTGLKKLKPEVFNIINKSDNLNISKKKSQKKQYGKFI